VNKTAEMLYQSKTWPESWIGLPAKNMANTARFTSLGY